MLDTLLRSARGFFFGTLISRFGGLFRDMAMAMAFGAAPEYAGFLVAYRFANLGRRLLAEGNLHPGFIPHYVSLKSEDAGKANSFFREMSASVGWMAIGFVGALELLLWGLCQVVSADWTEILHLTMTMMPSLVFLSLFGLNSALLQCQHRTFISAAAPVACNVIWTVAALSLGGFEMGTAMRLLGLSLVVAFGAQWLATAWALRGEGGWKKPFTEECKKLVRPLTLGIVGVGAIQFNTALDSIFARIADPSGPAFLHYGIRFYQLPIGLIGVGLAGALLPLLTRALAAKDEGLYEQTLKSSLHHAAGILFPCMFGLMVVGGSMLNLIYGRGKFAPHDVAITMKCLSGYLIGVVPAVFVLLLANAFYAKKDYKTPMKASLLSVAFNGVLNGGLVYGAHLGALSIAIATSVSSLFNAFLLHRSLKIAMPNLSRPFLAGAIPALFAWTVGGMCGEGSVDAWISGTALFPRDLITQVMQFCLMTGLYVGGVMGMVRALGLSELFDLFRKRDEKRARAP